ncbi:DGQHR domain-containing protein [Zunongwangia endophytica]|uniref:DGQHR domain-containing protein n=1 Tax=Zunongwangia endophytica TaxID=1808945 RepID=A0ABV8HAY4_9FLAO|nr:DGQHR domain-containing protein [Zunongwangia endophytica]MDN3594395.1 DGQHR domain-containing protein [Zunongwangia endophytica]
MKIESIVFKQNNQKYLSFVLPYSELHRISKVLVYEQDDNGYQRKPNKLHINRIKKFITDDITNFKLPTSIILGVDSSDVEMVRTTENGLISIDFDKFKNKPFRIVDGQHRILGMEKALENVGSAEEVKKLNEYPFNIVTVVTDENNRSVELDIFIDINSKGKKVSTDLAELARYNYRIKEKSIENNITNISEHIAMKASKNLREDKSSIWSYAIKFDIHSDTNIGIIGVSAFRKSITGIIKNYLTKKNAYGLLKLDDEDLIKECDEHAKIIKDFLGKCWDESVRKKWSGCFKENLKQNDYEELVKVYFSRDYYIQKPLGAKSINKMIELAVSDTNNLDEAYKKFDEKIVSSNVTSKTWKVGDVLSGLNSESGFKKIREMISNERNIPVN